MSDTGVNCESQFVAYVSHGYKSFTERFTSRMRWPERWNKFRMAGTRSRMTLPTLRQASRRSHARSLVALPPIIPLVYTRSSDNLVAEGWLARAQARP